MATMVDKSVGSIDRKVLDEYEKTIVRAEAREQFKRLMTAHEAYIHARPEVLELSRAGKNEEAQELNRTTLHPLYTAYQKEGDGLFEGNNSFGNAAASAGQKAVGLAHTVTISLATSGICQDIFFALFLVKERPKHRPSAEHRTQQAPARASRKACDSKNPGASAGQRCGQATEISSGISPVGERRSRQARKPDGG
jgi:hypothetical protein